jgi:hypothetical protein
MKQPSPQTELYFGPQEGEIWVCEPYIVIITSLRHRDRFGRWNPRCFEFITIGQVKWHGDGAYWTENLCDPEGGHFTDPWIDYEGRCMADIYFTPWDGKGVFFCSKEAAAIERLKLSSLAALKKSDWKRREEIEAKIKVLFQSQVTQGGFR